MYKISCNFKIFLDRSYVKKAQTRVVLKQLTVLVLRNDTYIQAVGLAEVVEVLFLFLTQALQVEVKTHVQLDVLQVFVVCCRRKVASAGTRVHRCVVCIRCVAFCARLLGGRINAAI